MTNKKEEGGREHLSVGLGRESSEQQSTPKWLAREWEKRGYPQTGPTLRTFNEDFSPLNEELSEYLEIPEQKGADEKDNEDGIK